MNSVYGSKFVSTTMIRISYIIKVRSMHVFIKYKFSLCCENHSSTWNKR